MLIMCTAAFYLANIPTSHADVYLLCGQDLSLGCPHHAAALRQECLVRLSRPSRHPSCTIRKFAVVK